MRWGAPLALLLLAACEVPLGPVAGPAPDPLPVGAADTCGAAPHAALIGQPATALEREMILRQVRLIRPNTPVTRDYRQERINFHIDGNEQVTAITCG